MTSSSNQSVALVTGASRGIGRAIALDLAKHGYHVALVARTESRLNELQREIGEREGKASVFPYDLSEPSGLDDLVQKIGRQCGGIDVLVNNAGIFPRHAVDQAELESWDEALNLNLRSLIHLTHFCVPYLEKSSNPAIINMASIAGQRTMPRGGIYNATKHGLIGFSGASFEDLREKGIKVTAICPGFVRTEMVEGHPGLDPQKMIQTEALTETVQFILNFPSSGCPTEITIRPQKTPYLS